MMTPIDHTGDPAWIKTLLGWQLLADLRKEIVTHLRPRGGKSTWTEYYDDTTQPATLVRRDILSQPGRAILTGGTPV